VIETEAIRHRLNLGYAIRSRRCGFWSFGDILFCISFWLLYVSSVTSSGEEWESDAVHRWGVKVALVHVFDEKMKKVA
jgi:hypothetical protein